MGSLQDFETSNSHPSTALAPTATTTNTNPSAANSSASSPSSSSTLSRYESQKRRDWNTFGQYLRNHHPPISLSGCNGAHVLEFLRHLDQFGKTKVHTQLCPFFGHPNPPAACPCPLQQAWGSLDALIGRLRAAYEEHGGKPEANPFGAQAVRLYLSEVRYSQAKARGIGYKRKRRKRPPQGPPPLPTPEKMMDAQPRTDIALWKANLEKPKLNQPDPSVAILDNTTISRRSRRRQGIYTSPEARCKPGVARHKHETCIKLASGNENDRQQLQRSCDACKGISQATGPAFLSTSEPPAAQATAPPHAEDLELAMAINASIQTAVAETPNFHLHSGNEASSSSSEWTMTEAGSGSNSTEGTQIDNNNVSAAHTTVQTSDSAPSAPPAMDEIIEDGRIQYPSIASTSIDLSSSNVEKQPDSAPQTKEDGSSSSCAICLDAPSEAACVPCGHVAGCMSCLNEIKAKKWGCPVCRAKIEQVLKLYRV